MYLKFGLAKGLLALILLNQIYGDNAMGTFEKKGEKYVLSIGNYFQIRSY